MFSNAATLGYTVRAVPHWTAGIGTPSEAAKGRIVRPRLFSCLGAQFMGVRAGAVARLAGASPVVPTSVRSPTLIGTGVGGYHAATEATAMNTLTVLSAPIRQLDGLYSLNDLHKASGAAPKHRPSQFMRLDTIKALIEEIQSADQRIAAKSIHGGSGRGSYACKELVYAYAMWISPSFHLKVIRAFDAMHTQPEPLAKPSLIPFIATTDRQAIAGQRLLVSVSDDAQIYHCRVIDPACCVMTPKEFLKALTDPNGLLFGTDDTSLLFDAVERLQGMIRNRHAYLAGRG